MRNQLLGLTLAMIAFGGAAVGGCSAFGPTGTNKSTTVYSVPDESTGVVVLSFKGKEDDTAATFELRNAPADAKVPELKDTSPDGTDKEDDPCKDVPGFCVSFKPADAGLPGNVYLVDVTTMKGEEDTGTKAGTLAFVVKEDAGATPAADESATPAADASATPAAQ